MFTGSTSTNIYPSFSPYSIYEMAPPVFVESTPTTICLADCTIIMVISITKMHVISWPVQELRTSRTLSKCYCFWC